MKASDREYRKLLGYKNQEDLKRFFKGTDIVMINWEKIRKYDLRLCDIFLKINNAITAQYQLNEDEREQLFYKILEAHAILKDNQVIETKFNNNGRAYEDVYYNWMRGYVVGLYFVRVLADTFQVDVGEIEQLGKDNLEELATKKDPAVFRKEAIADFKIESKRVHIEVQSGFTGINDIKQSKARDARIRYHKSGWRTVLFHFDLFNGRMAAIDITNSLDIPAKRWKSNPKFEGVATTSIPEEMFKWRITEPVWLNESMITILG